MNHDAIYPRAAGHQEDKRNPITGEAEACECDECLVFLLAAITASGTKNRFMASYIGLLEAAFNREMIRSHEWLLAKGEAERRAMDKLRIESYVIDEQNVEPRD